MLLLIGLAAPCLVAAQAVPLPPAGAMGIAMEGYSYPFPVRYLPLRIQGQDVRMAFMDVRPTGVPNGKTIILLHGKNFFAAYWRGPIERLSATGYRVVAPDQVGFGKSSKPAIRYSFDLFAKNTVAIADRLGIRRFAVLGHSMGGMVAMRLARNYPTRVEKLILENPIGLEDYGKVVPPTTLQALYAGEMRQSEEAFRRYVANYYVRKNSELIEPFVRVRSAISHSSEFPRWAMAAALTTQTILRQPTVYDLPKILAPTLLIIGQADRTAVAKDRVPEKVRASLGNYPALGRRAARALRNGRLAPIPGVGHIPHLEAPDAFYAALLPFLSGR